VSVSSVGVVSSSAVALSRCPFESRAPDHKGNNKGNNRGNDNKGDGNWATTTQMNSTDTNGQAENPERVMLALERSD